MTCLSTSVALCFVTDCHHSYTRIFFRHTDLHRFRWFSFFLILGTKTSWIFWRALERGSFIRARFSFLSFKLRVVNRASFNCGFLKSFIQPGPRGTTTSFSCQSSCQTSALGKLSKVRLLVHFFESAHFVSGRSPGRQWRGGLLFPG